MKHHSAGTGRVFRLTNRNAGMWEPTPLQRRLCRARRFESRPDRPDPRRRPMNLHPTSRPTKSVLAGLFVVAIASLAIGWTVGTVAASNGSRAASPTAAPKGAGADTLGMPSVGTTTTVPQYAGGTSASRGSGLDGRAAPGDLFGQHRAKHELYLPDARLPRRPAHAGSERCHRIAWE